MQHVKGNWRILFGLGVVPSLVQLCLMHWLPESPRVLILRGQDDEAREVLKKIYKYATPEIIELKFKVVKDHVEATPVLQRTTTFWQRSKKLWTHKPYRRSIFTVSFIQVFGQFTGYVSPHSLRKTVPFLQDELLLFCEQWHRLTEPRRIPSS